MVSLNQGQAFQAINKVASGGELSRVSLAIHAVTAKKHQTPSLIFDEVDIGISGSTAEIVGTLLQDLSKDAQICCITHLAQVAAKGHQHLKVEKTHQNNNTETRIEKLNAEGKIQEIARMIGGINIRDVDAHHRCFWTGLFAGFSHHNHAVTNGHFTMHDRPTGTM